MNTPDIPCTVDVWHNILWSRYKGEIFSCLYEQSASKPTIRFFQIAETSGARATLSGIDTQYHRYPYHLVFTGSLDAISLPKRLLALFLRTVRSNAELTVLAGYEKPEYWLQLFILLLRRKKVAVFCDSTIHDQEQKPVRGMLKRFFFRSVNGIFCYGSRSREYVIRYGADPACVFANCQAAALPVDYTPEAAISGRIRLAAAQETPRYLYVGRLSAEKGLDDLLSAFAAIKSENPQATLILVGDGPERQMLENMATSLGLTESVTFTGSKSGENLTQEYQKATCLILPSRSEPWGLVVNEALSHGCPVIVSDICGCVPELVLTGKTGFTFKAGDIAELARKMSDAPRRFSEVDITTGNCMELIAGFTPAAAASQILYGIRNILFNGAPDGK